jgi:RNase P/RNase MRP subunit POP5
VKRNRYRYIAVRVDGDDIRKEDMIAALNRLPLGAMGGAPDRVDRLWLVHFQEGFALVRCGHLQKDSAIELLNGIESVRGKKVALSTLGTSGTIKAALAKYAK